MNSFNTHLIDLVKYGFSGGVGFGLAQLWIRTKSFKRIFSPCKECHFIPGRATWTSPTDGSLHQVQECERCGQKRDVVLYPKNLEAAQKFFFGQQQP